MKEYNLHSKVEEVNKAFKESQFSFIVEIENADTNKVAVEIVRADWEKVHCYADKIMRKNGFVKVYEKMTDEGTSNCYSSIHYYINKDLSLKKDGALSKDEIIGSEILIGVDITKVKDKLGDSWNYVDGFVNDENGIGIHHLSSSCVGNITAFTKQNHNKQNIISYLM